MPLKPQGYRFQADFEEATQLADNADVRISGVPVGRVIRSTPAGRPHARDHRDRRRVRAASRATPGRSCARRRCSARRTSSSRPGDASKGTLPDGGVLPATQVKPTVELDEILRAFDPSTRRDLQRMLLDLSHALEGRGEDLNDALGNAQPFTDRRHRPAAHARLAARRGAPLVADTGTVFDSLGRRQGELQGLITAGDRLLATTARRNSDLAETVRILPTTLRELRPDAGRDRVVQRRGGAAGARPAPGRRGAGAHAGGRQRAVARARGAVPRARPA